MSNLIDNLILKMKDSPVVNSPQVPFLPALTLSQHTIGRYDAWRAECYAKAIAKQREQVQSDDPFYSTYETMWDMGFPYEGATGGGFTIEITPTSLGYAVNVRYDYVNETIDLTEYDL
jgi:hypothetical protein